MNAQLKQIICFLFWHKVGDLNESGYPICERCGSHSYYDEWKAGIFVRPIWAIQRTAYNVFYAVKHWYKKVFLGDELPF